MNIIGDEDEDVLETPEDDDRVGVFSTIIGTRSVTLPFQKTPPQKTTAQTLVAGTEQQWAEQCR